MVVSKLNNFIIFIIHVMCRQSDIQLGLTLEIRLGNVHFSEARHFCKVKELCGKLLAVPFYLQFIDTFNRNTPCYLHGACLRHADMLTILSAHMMASEVETKDTIPSGVTVDTLMGTSTVLLGVGTLRVVGGGTVNTPVAKKTHKICSLLLRAKSRC